jgi:signal recognition particle subunit SRP54
MFESLTKTFDAIRTRLAGKPKLTEENIQEALRQVRVALLEADVNFKVCKDFIARVQDKAVGLEVIAGVNPGDQFIKSIHDSLVELMGPDERQIGFAPAGPTVILMAGLQGTGKTTTCAKLALRLKKQGRKPLLVAADIQRPAAIEQLMVLGRQIDVPVFARPGGHPPAICADAVAAARAGGQDLVILDTAGRLHVDQALMDEVSAVAKATTPHEIFLVLDANTGQDAVQSAQAFNEKLALTGVILTKMDSGTRGGAALSVRAVTGKPIVFVGTGEKVEKLEPFHPARLADRILGMGDVVSLVERAQESIDQKEAEQTARQLFEGSFDFSDFLRMLGMIKGMGPIKDLMKMVPGMSAHMDSLEGFDEKEFYRSEAIIRSMTAQERARPEILNMSRRDRVAQGAGVKVESVHELVRGFKQMKEQIHGLKKAGVLGRVLDPGRSIQKQKRDVLKDLDAEGKSVFDLPEFRGMRPVAAKASKEKRRKR